jgi:hypothetical protein
MISRKARKGYTLGRSALEGIERWYSKIKVNSCYAPILNSTFNGDSGFDMLDVLCRWSSGRRLGGILDVGV